MKARILISSMIVTTFAGVLPAVDQQLLNLVMPDAKILAGVNVASAKSSPFGQYVLAQIAPHNEELQKMAVMTGFDPRQDLVEILAATNGATGNHSGLALASGTFNTSAIIAAATAAGASTQVYKGATIISDPNPKATEPGGIAFLSSTLAVAGDLANVKAAIDRQTAPSKIDTGLAKQANDLSATQDAWVVSIIAPPAPPKPAVAGQNRMGQAATDNPAAMLPLNALQQIQSGSAGVKFGTNVVVTAQAQADNAQDAANLAGMIQLLANMAKMQSDKNPQAAALANALTVTSSGTTINATFTVPQEMLQNMVAAAHSTKKPAHLAPKK